MKFKKTIYTSLTAVALLAPAATGLVQSSVPSIVHAQSSEQYDIANYQWNQAGFDKLSASEKKAIYNKYMAQAKDVLFGDQTINPALKGVFVTGNGDGAEFVESLIKNASSSDEKRSLANAQKEGLSPEMIDNLKRFYGNAKTLTKILIESNAITPSKDPSTPVKNPSKPVKDPSTKPTKDSSGKDSTKPTKDSSGKDSTKPEESGKDSTKPTKDSSGKDSTKPEESGKDSTKPEDSKGTPVISTTGVSEESNIPQAGSEEQGLFAKIVAFIVGLFN